MHKDVFLERFHSNERVIMLSDGVFAIVLTLLVLELRLPPLPKTVTNTELWHALLSIKSKVISFLLTFFFITSLWFNHNQMFKIFDKVDNLMLWLNNFLLLLICFLPFPTAMISDHPANSIGIILFGIISAILPLIFYGLIKRAYVKKFINASVDIKHLLKLSRIAFVLCPISVIPLFFASTMPLFSMCCYIVITIAGAIVGSTIKFMKD